MLIFTDITGINSGDQDPQELDSQRASDIHTGHTPQEPSIQSMDVDRVYSFPDEQITPDNASRDLSLTERELGIQMAVFSAAQSLANMRTFITGGTHKNLQFKVLKQFLKSMFHKNLLIKVQKKTLSLMKLHPSLFH